jgi:hypothetical protein
MVLQTNRFNIKLAQPGMARGGARANALGAARDLKRKETMLEEARERYGYTAGVARSLYALHDVGKEALAMKRRHYGAQPNGDVTRGFLSLVALRDKERLEEAPPIYAEHDCIRRREDTATAFGNTL